MIYLRKIRLVIISIICITVCSCDEIYECLFDINPEIHKKQLSVATLGESYFERITAEINNEVNDDDYLYYFEVVGELPLGIYFERNRRSISFYGTPEVLGTYRFRVELFVDYSYDYDSFDNSPTCEESTSERFTIIVEE